MKRRALKAILLFLVVLCSAHFPAASAACMDIVRPSDLPAEVETPGGVRLIYSYQLQPDETYTIAWSKGAVSGGPIGPFPLQPGCKVPEISAESDAFLLLEKGCGSFCWYFDVLGLSATAGSPAGTHEQIFRPLAFDSARNLLAYYPQKDSIAIRNLLTGYEQVFATARVCDTGSGLCFGDVRFVPNGLQYTWQTTTGVGSREVLSQAFDAQLVAQ